MIQVTVVHAVMMMNAAFVEHLLPRTRVLTGSSALHARDGHVESATGAQTIFSSFVRSVNNVSFTEIVQVADISPLYCGL